MKVIVQTHESARQDIDRWFRSLPGSSADRAALVANALDALEEELVRTGGRPAGAAAVPGRRPPTFRWQFTRGRWLEYCIQVQGGYWRGRRTTVTILAVPSQPDGGTPR